MRQAIALFAAASLLGACSDDGVDAVATSSSAGGGGGGGGSAGPGGSAASGGEGGNPIGPAPTELVDRGLLVRYLINEDTTGQAPTELDDVAPEPLALSLNYVPELTFAEVDGHRGLRWTDIETDGRASIAVDGTKIATLQDATEATIEVVVELADASLSQSRLSHIGTGTESGRFTLSSASPTRLQLSVNSLAAGIYQVDFFSSGRAVVHAVLDSGAAEPEGRVRVYLDGARLSAIGGDPPDQEDAIDLPSGLHYVLGNREIGDRSPLGVLYYAALYRAALSDAEVLDNTLVLLACDDAP